MSKHNLLYATIGLLAGFIIGFIFANQVNRGQTETARSTAARTQPSETAQGGETGTQNSNSSRPAQPSAGEVREAIARADARAEDVDLQHKFGMALYRYATQAQNAEFLPDVARMLKRAHDADPKNRDLTVALGNVLFDIGQSSDPARFSEARQYYQKALEMKADDVSVRTDLGLTYFFGQPSDPARAIAEYRKSLALDPRHEPTLQNLATALISTGKTQEAQQIIEQLSSLNPSNPALSNLRAQMAQSKNQRPE